MTIPLESFYLLPRSKREKIFELANITMEQKFKDNANLLSIVLNGKPIFT